MEVYPSLEKIFLMLLFEFALPNYAIDQKKKDILPALFSFFL